MPSLQINIVLNDVSIFVFLDQYQGKKTVTDPSEKSVQGDKELKGKLII